MSKLIGRRVVVTTDRGTFRGYVGTISEAYEADLAFPIVVSFYGHDTRYCYEPDELRYLNGKQVKL